MLVTIVLLALQQVGRYFDNEEATGSRSQPLRNGAIDQLPDRCLLRHNYRNKTDAVNCLVTVMSGCRKQMWLTMSRNI